MLKKIALIALLIVFQLQAQERIKLMSYNLMHFPSTYVYNVASNSFVDRSPTLKLITDEVQPDILMVCELQNQTGANAILDNVLNVGTDKYAMPTFTYNQSTTYTDLNQFLYYNSEKLTLENQSVLTTAIRDINNYTFLLNTVDKDTNPIYLEVFVAHLKASIDTTNQQKRLDMINVFTSNLASIPASHHIVFAGDFNFYTASEPGYQELIDPTNAIKIVDPIDQEGSWHINGVYKSIHTQSPLTDNNQFSANYGNNNAGSDGVLGGLDDRFDFIMIDENTQTSTDLHYVTGTYSAFGNNGNCYNDNIDDTDCDGFYSQQTRDNLANMSDHLPVVMELETSSTFLGNSLVTMPQFMFGNVVSDVLTIKNVSTRNYIIYNDLGQKVLSGKLDANAETRIAVSSLSNGVYMLKIVNAEPLKFIKTGS